MIDLSKIDGGSQNYVLTSIDREMKERGGQTKTLIAACQARIKAINANIRQLENEQARCELYLDTLRK